jgi:transcription elongation factor GreB
VSKAFTRESDDDLDGALSIEDRALPPGVPNYITPAGAARLRAEIERLRGFLPAEGRRKIDLEGRIASLGRRLDSAEIIDPASQPRDRVLFGAAVTLRDEQERVRRYRIVGLDEASAQDGALSWLSPVARALLNGRVGEVVTLRTPAGDEEVEITAIDYPSPARDPLPAAH